MVEPAAPVMSCVLPAAPVLSPVDEPVVSGLVPDPVAFDVGRITWPEQAATAKIPTMLARNTLGKVRLRAADMVAPPVIAGSTPKTALRTVRLGAQNFLLVSAQ
jgi:hypothetical protein